MSTAKHETNRPLVDHDVEIRIRDFRNFTIAALCNFTVLIVHVGILWVWMEAIPSTTFMPFPLRWACIVCLYLETIAENAWLFWIIVAIKRSYMSEIEYEKRSPNRDLGTRTTNVEDWILANFCAIVGLATMGFLGWYWTRIIALTIPYWARIIALTFRSSFYWIGTMGGLSLLFWLLKRTMQFYRAFRGVKYEEAWGILLSVNVLRFYSKFEGVQAEGTLGLFLDFVRAPFELLKFWLDKVGFHIGRGPLFDRLSDELKAARRRCKTHDDIDNFLASYFAFAAGSSVEEGDKREDGKDRDEREEVYFPPSAYEFGPNPYIHAHVRDEHLQPLNHGTSVAKNTSHYHLVDTSRAAGRLCPDMAVEFDDKGIAKNNQKSRGIPRHTGPATMSANLSSFVCPQCNFVANKRFKLNKHVTQTHNHRFKCVYHGCGKTFGIRTLLERHEAIHIERKGFECPNSWCRTPEKMFTREDNLKRHMRRCITSG